MPEQAITFDKAIVPVGEEEESQRVRALLVMKNAMREREHLSDPSLLNQQCIVQQILHWYIKHFSVVVLQGAFDPEDLI